MTTTKKKATLAQRVTELEAWQKGERMRGDHFAERITALEQAQRPAELCSVCGGSGQHPGTYTCVVCLGAGLVKPLPLVDAQEPSAQRPAEKPAKPQPVADDDDAGRLACARCGLVPLALRESGHTLCWECHHEEDRLQRAVVDAALEHLACDHDPDAYCGHAHDVLAAARDLRAHRAKKGGA